MGKELEFTVTINMGPGPGFSGDVCVDVEVSKKEYALLKKCCREYDDICDCEELADLNERVIAAAREESEGCAPDGEDPIDYDDAEFFVQIPDELYDE